MVVKGKLVLKDDKVEYGIFTDGNFYSISDRLIPSLMDIVHITLKDKQGNELFNHSGELYLDNNKTGRLYKFYIKNKQKYSREKYCLDDVLWNLVGSIVEIEIVDEERLEDIDEEVEAKS
jgi:hypothetical protein